MGAADLGSHLMQDPFQNLLQTELEVTAPAIDEDCVNLAQSCPLGPHSTGVRVDPSSENKSGVSRALDMNLLKSLSASFLTSNRFQVAEISMLLL